jgi:hypothetical protein
VLLPQAVKAILIRIPKSNAHPEPITNLNSSARGARCYSKPFAAEPFYPDVQM